MGPLLIDVEGVTLTEEDIRLLQHHAVGGVILFERNCPSREAVIDLVKSIRRVAPDLLIMIDQEGGRVRRLTEKAGFAPLGPLHAIGQWYDQNQIEGLQAAYDHAYDMASQVLSLGIDLSLAPVCDLFNTTATVIGNRAFHHDPKVVVKLAKAYIVGMHDAGMAAMAKHFPGHGSVSVDSHEALPTDNRPLEAILASDGSVFAALAAGVDSIMPAHILYPQVDADHPVGFSKTWMSILKEKLGFEGVICTDDVGAMIAAVQYGKPIDRVDAALKSGGDLVLFCNNRTDLLKMLEENRDYQWPEVDETVLYLKRHQSEKCLEHCGCEE